MESKGACSLNPSSTNSKFYSEELRPLQADRPVKQNWYKMRDGETVEIGRPSGVKEITVFMRFPILSEKPQILPILCKVCQSGSSHFETAN